MKKLEGCSLIALMRKRISATFREFSIFINMLQSYKVFVNNSCILFVENFDISNCENFIFKQKDVDFFDIYDDFMYFFENNKNLITNNIVLKSNNAHDAFSRFKENFLYISAGGGVVKNQFQQILLIHKNNTWDLPKGKIESGETPIETAKREVFEETNVSVTKIINLHSYSTYHIYKDQFNFNKMTLKETKWFDMISNCNSVLKPQIQEGILDVRWFAHEDIYALNTYHSTIEPINFFL